MFVYVAQCCRSGGFEDTIPLMHGAFTGTVKISIYLILFCDALIISMQVSKERLKQVRAKR